MTLLARPALRPLSSVLRRLLSVNTRVAGPDRDPLRDVSPAHIEGIPARGPWGLPWPFKHIPHPRPDIPVKRRTGK